VDCGRLAMHAIPHTVPFQGTIESRKCDYTVPLEVRQKRTDFSAGVTNGAKGATVAGRSRLGAQNGLAKISYDEPPQGITTVGDRSFAVAGPRVWNS